MEQIDVADRWRGYIEQIVGAGGQRKQIEQTDGADKQIADRGWISDREYGGRTQKHQVRSEVIFCRSSSIGHLHSSPSIGHLAQVIFFSFFSFLFFPFFLFFCFFAFLFFSFLAPGRQMSSIWSVSQRQISLDAVYQFQQQMKVQGLREGCLLQVIFHRSVQFFWLTRIVFLQFFSAEKEGRQSSWDGVFIQQDFSGADGQHNHWS